MAKSIYFCRDYHAGNSTAFHLWAMNLGVMAGLVSFGKSHLEKME